MAEPGNIKKLDEVVINRIAAGEVIQRPANALKELIENSLDANASNITITVKDGGLKLLDIQDNGSGICKDDFEIVCERFTTSKLTEFEDLNTIATFGFRGEALASISHVAHLSIISKTSKQVCAYRASYVDGKMLDNIIPMAGNQGTQITVEDLFYNMTIRKNTRSSAEEYQKISDVVGKYAVHNAKIGFGLKKQGENNDIHTPANSKVVDNIRTIYGNLIARELIEFSHENKQFKFSISGYMTNVNYSSKKMQFILFINHRLVDCQSLKRCIDQIYGAYLPKNMHPFVYLSLEIEPRNIDVNIHPTKHEVHFLNEEQIVDIISKSVETKLLGSNNSRVFYTQAKLPGVLNTNITIAEHNKTLNKSVHDKDLVRTDSNEQKLEKFFGPTTKRSILNNSDANDDSFNNSFVNKSITKEDINLNNDSSGEDVSLENTLNVSDIQIQGVLKNEDIIKDRIGPRILKTNHQKKHKSVSVGLKSIQQLQDEILDKAHDPLRDLFAEHVFVGTINSKQSLIQHTTKLYLCDTEQLMEEMFYQFLVFNFQNFNSYTFAQPLALMELAKISLDHPSAGWTPQDGDKQELAESIVQILTEKGEMLDEYYSIEIDADGFLKSIPIIIDNHMPELSHLPIYILRLATQVNWNDERECFQTFSRETAKFYAKINETTDYKFATEHVYFTILKEYFSPSQEFTKNAAILQIADLPNLYKVFERC